MNGAGNCISELNFFIADTVTANDRASGFDHFGKAAGKDLSENLQICLFRKTDHGQRTDGAASHGVDITKRVDRRNLSEGVRVIDDGSEKIYGLHQGKLGRNLIDAGVIGGGKADKNILVVLPRQLSKNGGQRRPT